MRQSRYVHDRDGRRVRPVPPDALKHFEAGVKRLPLDDVKVPFDDML